VAERVFFRSPRGGNCPLDARGRRELLSLYAGWHLTVAEIAEHFGCSVGTITRWLYLLGVRPQHEMTAAERKRFDRLNVAGHARRRRTRTHA